MQRVAERSPNLSEPHGTILTTVCLATTGSSPLSRLATERSVEALIRSAYYMFLLVDAARTISLPNHRARPQRRRRKDVPQISFFRCQRIAGWIFASYM